MLEIQELSKSYGKHLAVDQVSFFYPGRAGGDSSGAERCRKVHDY